MKYYKIPVDTCLDIYFMNGDIYITQSIVDWFVAEEDIITGRHYNMISFFIPHLSDHVKYIDIHRKDLHSL